MEKSSQKKDHEWGVGESADGSINVFDPSELPAKLAEIEEAERAAIAREPKNLAPVLEQEAKALESEAKGDIDISDLDDYDDLSEAD